MAGATATVLGGFWPANSVSSLTQINGKGANKRTAARALSTKGMYYVRELARTLDGVVPGSTATKNYRRVVNSTELGGVRATENDVLVNRATVAGDATAINADILSLSARTTMASPTNKDGNPLGYR